MDFVELIWLVCLEHLVKFLDFTVFFDLPVLLNLQNLSGLQNFLTFKTFPEFLGYAEVPKHPKNYGTLDFLRPLKPIETQFEIIPVSLGSNDHFLDKIVSFQR